MKHPRTLPITLAFTLTALLGACSGADDGGDGSSSSSGSTSEASTSEGSSSDGSTSAGSTSAGSTEGTTGSTTESTGEPESSTSAGTTGEDACPPADDVHFEFGWLSGPELMPGEHEWVCKVLGVFDGKEGGSVIELSCTEGEMPVEPAPSLVIDASPAPSLVNFTAGAGVRVIHGHVMPWWIEKWIRVESLMSGDLLLAGVSGSSLAPGGGGDLFAPASIEVIDGECAPFANGCGVVERLRLDVDAEGVLSTVHDRSFHAIGGDPGYSLWVDQATSFIGEIECTDTPQRWFSIGMIFDGQE